MPRAAIVAAARSPIGRAHKGSLVGVRPDDLTVPKVRAAPAQVPALDPHEIDDVVLGCGRPGGEQGHNMVCVVSVLLGLDDVPGTTGTGYCASRRPRDSRQLLPAQRRRGRPARITTTLLDGLRARDQTIRLGTKCVGGGQGMALERLS